MIGDAEPPGGFVWEVDLQSEHKSSTSSVEVIEAQVTRLDASPATVRRRASPGQTSRRSRAHGLTPQQVFTWRRQAVGKSRKEMGAAGPSFAMVAVENGDAGVVEIAVGEVRLRIGPMVPATRVKEILQAVRSA
jgi:hypothetical protein